MRNYCYRVLREKGKPTCPACKGKQGVSIPPPIGPATSSRGFQRGTGGQMEGECRSDRARLDQAARRT